MNPFREPAPHDAEEPMPDFRAGRPWGGRSIVVAIVVVGLAAFRAWLDLSNPRVGHITTEMVTQAVVALMFAAVVTVGQLARWFGGWRRRRAEARAIRLMLRL